MNLTQVTALVNSRIGNLIGYDTTIQTKMEYVKEMKLERDSTLRPWFLQVRDTEAIVSGASSFTLPNDYLAEDADQFMKVVDTPDYYTKILPSQEAEISTTEQKAYFIRGGDVNFFPEATESFTFEFWYYQKTATLATSSTDNPWLLYAADLLAAETAYEFMLDMQDQAGANIQAGLAFQARQRIINETIERKLSNMI